ncbi:hypothetical protein BRADI_2g21930v3 [Brachypodium distachyon]|uniref:Uncharacterized protein n=1 Tax=Brachypodium distachyon TaxID=15368 RepID=I1HIA2_BRADI|nr:hypothetical protein BRADI_2g21930v3 [Brachypodium distachyon]
MAPNGNNRHSENVKLASRCIDRKKVIHVDDEVVNAPSQDSNSKLITLTLLELDEISKDYTNRQSARHNTIPNGQRQLKLFHDRYWVHSPQQYNRYVHRLDADVGELPFLKKKNYCWHVSQQPNGYNCGAFAMYNTCRFIRRPPLVFQEEDCSKSNLLLTNLRDLPLSSGC